MAEQQNPDPLFGRKTWTYVGVVRGPVRGPQPRLARGTGLTGRPAAKGTGAQLPGYVSDNDYAPSPFTYQPRNDQTFLQRVPREFPAAQDGRDIVGTYKPHDFAPGTRFNHQMRSAANWQVQAFPPSFRNTVQYQQAMIYRVQSNTLSAQPLAKSNYFLGYEVQPEIGAKIGQNTLGYMGSA